MWLPSPQHTLQLKGSVKELNTFHNYETEKITCKASDIAENLQLYRVVRFFRPRSLCTTMHLVLFSECLPIYIDIFFPRDGHLDLLQANYLSSVYGYGWDCYN